MAGGTSTAYWLERSARVSNAAASHRLRALDVGREPPNGIDLLQPADPIGEWRSPPFEPAVREGSLYGRGSCDDKGQMFAHVKAVECLLRTNTRLPVNVKCLFEGEEEIGSPHLQAFVTANRTLLHADVAVMSDMPIAGPGQPALTYAFARFAWPGARHFRPATRSAFRNLRRRSPQSA